MADVIFCPDCGKLVSLRFPVHMCLVVDDKKIVEEVTEAVAHSLEGFNIDKIIDETKLSPYEKKWAKEHLDWQIVVLE
jgi:hypothetical protein